MDKATVPGDAGGDSEAALWAQLENDVADKPEVDDEVEETAAKVAPEAEKPEPEPEKEPEKAEKQPDKLPYEELEKRHKQLNGALAEERATRKQLAEQKQQMETLLRAIAAERQARAQPQQPEAPKIPDINEDPVGFFQHKIAEQERIIEELRNGTKQTREQIEAENAQRQFWGEVQRSEVEARQKLPDYDDAVTWLEAARVKEIARMLPDTPQAQRLAEQRGFATVEDMRTAMLNHDRQSIAAQAFRVGRSPAEMYYEIAQDRGWQGKPKPVETAKAAIAATKAGQAASKTIAGGAAGRSADDMSLDDLAELYIDDPVKADKIFKRMKEKGLLG